MPAKIQLTSTARDELELALLEAQQLVPRPAVFAPLQ
jgi:hypothetical protein